MSGFIPTTEIEGRLTALAFVAVLEGKKITGPDYSITRESILQIDKSGNLTPDATQFFHLYDPLRQSLMPTYNFLIKPDSQLLSNVNNEPSLRSDILLDLNALSTPGTILGYHSLEQIRERVGLLLHMLQEQERRQVFGILLFPG